MYNRSVFEARKEFRLQLAVARNFARSQVRDFAFCGIGKNRLAVRQGICPFSG